MVGRTGAQDREIPACYRGVARGLSKEARVTRLSPLVENGTLRFSRKVQRLIEQLIQFPKGDHDDGPDALEGG